MERFNLFWNRHSGGPHETFGCVVTWDDITTMVDIWASQQNPQIAEHIARTLRIPSNKVRVHMDVDIGGSYGNKRRRKQFFLTCVASRMVGRLVKFIEDRLEIRRAIAGNLCCCTGYMQIVEAIKAAAEMTQSQ